MLSCVPFTLMRHSPQGSNHAPHGYLIEATRTTLSSSLPSSFLVRQPERESCAHAYTDRQAQRLREGRLVRSLECKEKKTWCWEKYESLRNAVRNGAKKEGMKESCRGEWREMRQTDCQEVKKPTDRDQDEGMDGRGLGMACEKSREGGEEMENICSVYLLRSRMHDHSPPAVPQAFSDSFYFSLCLPLLVSSFIFLSVFPFLCLCPPHLSYYNRVRMAPSQMLKSFRIGF